MPGQNSTRLGQKNRERVRLYLTRNPGAKQIACARSLGLSANAVNSHVRALAQASGVNPRHFAKPSREKMP